MSQITILKVDQEKAPKGYVVTTVNYKDQTGKVRAMKVLPFKDQAQVAEAFSAAKPGEVWEVRLQKNDRDFWEFAPTPLKVGDQAQVTAPTAKGNWETAEERNKKQGYIIRQNSVTNAVAFMDAVKAKMSPQEVIEIAKVFENYVFNGTAEVKDVE